MSNSLSGRTAGTRTTGSAECTDAHGHQCAQYDKRAQAYDPEPCHLRQWSAL